MWQKTFSAMIEEFSEANLALTNALHSINCPDLTLKKILLAFEEIFVNIVNYAYPKKGGCITIALDKNSKDEMITISLVLKDKGEPFNPLETSAPDIGMDTDEREIGGLGIFLTKQIMDAVRYDRIDGENVLTLIKSWKIND